MVAKLEGLVSLLPQGLLPLLPSLSNVSLTTTPTSHLRTEATPPSYRPIGTHLWDQGHATHQQLCHHSMTCPKPDSEWNKTLYYSSHGSPAGEKTEKKEPSHPRPLKEFSDHCTRLIFQTPSLTRSFPCSKASRGSLEPLG